MQFMTGKKERWEEGLANNQDPYGAAIYSYAQRWAELMEEKMKFSRLEEIAKSTSHEADTEGITGFMYGAAVSILSQAWLWGDELRCWHNVESQLGDEGIQANIKKSTLNPALLVVGNDQ